MTYQVVAPLVLAKDQLGQVHHIYAGGLIPWLSDEQAKHFLGENLVEKVGGTEESSTEPTDDDAPAKAAPKSDWVDYAVAKGYDQAEVEEMTKADIQALDFG